MEKEIHYEVTSEEKDKKTIMLYGLGNYPGIGKMLTVTEETDSEGATWITTSGYDSGSVSVKLGNPPRGLFNSSADLSEHKAIITDLSINKWIEENGN